MFRTFVSPRLDERLAKPGGGIGVFRVNRHRQIEIADRLRITAKKQISLR